MKSTILKIAAGLIFLAVFNMIFFFGGIVRSEANWCSYAFFTSAYLCLLATPLFAKGCTSAILSASLWLRGSFYFFTELVVGFVFIIVNPESCQWPLIVQGCLLGIFLVLQIMSVMANDATESSLKEQKAKSFAKMELINTLSQQAASISDPTVKKPVNRCIDALTNCPLQSFPEAEEAELSVRNSVMMLCSSIDEGDSAQIKSNSDRLFRAIQNRNLIINQCRTR